MSEPTPNAANPEQERKVAEIRARIADLKKRWPAHSTPPGLMQQLDELEEELEEALSASPGTARA